MSIPAKPGTDPVSTAGSHKQVKRSSPPATASLLETLANTAIKAWCTGALRRNVRLRVVGKQHIPAQGPVLLVCRHFHHYYDGCVLLAVAPRNVHLLVALDWVSSRPLRILMESACKITRWPVVLRGERLTSRSQVTSAFKGEETGRYLREALRTTRALLRAGEVVAIFPEGYPNVDPVYTPKHDAEEHLPFRVGFVQLALAAQRAGSAPVAIVPVGFEYVPGKRWQITIRFGTPLHVAARGEAGEVVHAVEEEVRRLSAAAHR